MCQSESKRVREGVRSQRGDKDGRGARGAESLGSQTLGKSKATQEQSQTALCGHRTSEDRPTAGQSSCSGDYCFQAEASLRT